MLQRLNPGLSRRVLVELGESTQQAGAATKPPPEVRRETPAHDKLVGRCIIRHHNGCICLGDQGLGDGIPWELAGMEVKPATGAEQGARILALEPNRN